MRPSAAQAAREEPVARPLGDLWLPFALTGLILLISFTPRVQQNATLVWSFWGAAAALLALQGALVVRARRSGGALTLVRTELRKQHYIQAMLQISVFAYWGYHWRPVYDYAFLLLAQIAFAFAFDMMLSWWRRGSYTLGAGPFPIIFSTNLFLWFRDDWFYLQFLMVAVGFLGKEFVRWHREGRLVHIFNPSAFSLGLFSAVLIVTGSTSLTWGPEIASTLTLAPRIYTFLFLIGLVVMYFFSITLVAASAAIVLFGLSALYSAVTGVPYFFDSEIPAAVFLGLHLLVTDPSTSPRSRPGKAMFGVLYGFSVFGLYALLGAFGAPTFYDKLLAVPLLNLSVRRIDAMVADFRARRAAAPPRATVRPPRIDWGSPRINLVHMAVWILFFGAMTAMGRTDGRHTGDSVPFWVQACEEGRPNACDRLLQLEATYCGDNSGWACNELGGHFAEGRIVDANPQLALDYFARACELRYPAGCVNLLDPDGVRRADPFVLDLRLMLREGGLNLMEMPERDLFARACEHRWAFACERIAGSL